MQGSHEDVADFVDAFTNQVLCPFANVEHLEQRVRLSFEERMLDSDTSCR